MIETESVPFSISRITDPQKVRLVLYNNQSLVHVPLQALISGLEEKIAALEARIKVLETGKNTA